ncbi:inositol monophosphatase [Patescibacteria group bacterium]|nr:MAG: inositol monophosphatase [Patescibacteria group bacterium]
MSPELRIAVKTARDAGAILKRHFLRPDNRVRFKEKGGPVSEVDLASNRLILRRLAKAFPDDHLLSEESDRAPMEIGDGRTWIIDPLDGTTNYINGIPLFAVAIARVKDRVTELSVIYDPIHDEMFTAERGKGAFLNGKRIRVTRRSVAHGAMFLAGRGYRNRDRAVHRNIVTALELSMPYFRRLGSATIMLTSVAAGRADAVILTGDKPWDTAAGVLLVKEAGGRVTTYDGTPWDLTKDDLVASNRVIHRKVVETIRKMREEAM